jgi:DNA polymerase elongation subunit (family B)
MTPSKFVTRKIKEETNPNKPYTFKSWLTIDQYLDELIFDSRAYSVSYDFVPAFSMEVLDVRDFETIPVYDIEVESDHNFLANGITIKNCSLYPNLIISYNIDYTTCAFDPTIPDDLCHVMEWEDHISCKHDPKIIEKIKLTKTIDDLTSKKGFDKDLVSRLRKQRSEITKSLNKNVMCEKRKYRFLKTENHSEFKGVLPTIVQSLLDARKETRKEMNKLKEDLKTITDEHSYKEVETTISILNQRQLAYKVSANSMYGITGVKAGMLPFMPVAMSITYMGRTNIMKVAEVIQNKYNGHIVAGDTDSNYISFPHIKSIPQLWDYAIEVADEVSKLFPPPMKLEFEEAVYTKFLILTKKRYMYKTALRDGTIKPEIGKKGVLLNRRDNSAFIRNTYENMVKIIFDNTEAINILQEKVILTLINDINLMFTHQLPVDDFVITKSTGDYGNLQAQYFQNEKGIHRGMVGQYNVPFLTDEIRLVEGINTFEEETEWYLDKLPAHIQLLEKIKRRGQMRTEGSRLEYVIVETDDLKAKQSAKIETLNYYKKNKGIINLDYLYYLQRLINPVDQILEVIFNLKDFMKMHYNHRLLKKKLTIQVNDLFSPKFDIEMDRLYLLNIQNKYKLIYGSKKECKKILKIMDNYTLILKLDYVPTRSNLYGYLKSKYSQTSTLKTRFDFKDDFILLGDMTESHLVSTIKRACK